MKNIIKITSIVIVLLIGILVMLTALPQVGGYKALVVSTGSMEPHVKQGSLIFIKQMTDPEKGDVITYKLRSNPKTLITHRVVAIEEIKGEKEYQTKGDAVPSPDLQPVRKDQVVGKMVLTIPYFGLPVTFAKTQLGAVVLIVTPASLIVYEELKTILSEVKRLRTRVGVLEIKEEKSEEEVVVEEKKPKRINKKVKHKKRKKKNDT